MLGRGWQVLLSQALIDIIELGAHYNMISEPHKYTLVFIIIHARVIIIWLAGAVLAMQPGIDYWCLELDQ
jgi:hypothetical protein